MRGGLLKELLIFKSPVEVKSPTGAVKKEYQEVFRCRAHRQKMSYVSDDIKAMEQFIGNTLIFQVRNYPLIEENQHVSYSGSEYILKMVNHQFSDNTLLLTLQKMDK